VLNGLRDILLGDQALVDEFVAEFKREVARLRKERNGSARHLLKDLQEVERGIKRCLDFITGGDGDPGSVRDQLGRLEARKRVSLPICWIGSFATSTLGAFSTLLVILTPFCGASEPCRRFCRR